MVHSVSALPFSRSLEPTGSVSRTVQPPVPVLHFQDYVNSAKSLDRILIAQFNANSLFRHLDLVKAHLHFNFYHIISISETSLHDGIPDDMIRLGDYLLLRNVREGKRGGGVACYVHKSLGVRLLAASPSVFSNFHEYMILEIGCPGTNSLLFTSMYRRPEAISFDEFFNVYSRYSFAYKNIIIGGDLNCNLLGASFEAASLRESVSSHALSIVDSDSTFHTSIADSWLDVFIVDCLTKVLSFYKSEAPFIAGHVLIELSYRFESPPILARIIARRSYGGFNESAYREVLERALTVYSGPVRFPLLGGFTACWILFRMQSFLRWMIRRRCDRSVFERRELRGSPWPNCGASWRAMGLSDPLVLLLLAFLPLIS